MAIEIERCGQARGLLEMALGDVGGEPGCSVVELLPKPGAAADRLHRTDNMEHRINAAVGLDGKQLAMCLADLLWGAVERDHAEACGPGERAVRHRAGIGSRRGQLRPG